MGWAAWNRGLVLGYASAPKEDWSGAGVARSVKSCLRGERNSSIGLEDVGSALVSSSWITDEADSSTTSSKMAEYSVMNKVRSGDGMFIVGAMQMATGNF